MTAKEINNKLRTLIENKIISGFLKTDLCGVLLGSSRYSHFDKFLSNKVDFGLKPLQRIAQTFGYEMQIVFVPSEDEESLNSIVEANNSFIESLDVLLNEELSLPKKTGQGRGRKSKIKNAIDDYFSKYFSII